MSSNLYGKKAIIDAIKNKQEIDTIFCIKSIPEIKNIYPSANIKIVDKSFFKKIKVNHQFIMATLKNDIQCIELKQLLEIDKKNMTILILDQIEDSRNFGAIIRTCAAFNVDAVIYKNNHQAPINDFVIKSSMGGIQYVKLCEVSNINYAIDKLKEKNYWVFGTAINEKSLSLNDIKFSERTVIILGNENHGISNLTLSKCDECIFIPITNNVQSLNVSVAAGIILCKRYNN